MRRIDIIKRAGRNLSQAKGRTILTSLAIAVGAFTLTFSLALGDGMRNYVDQALKSNIDPKTIYVSRGVKVGDVANNANLYTSLREYKPGSTNRYGLQIETLDKNEVNTLKKIEHVKDISAYISLSPKYTEFEGIDKKYVANVAVYDPSVLNPARVGKIPELGKQIKEDEIVVPETYVDSLKIKPEDLINKKVKITFESQNREINKDDLMKAVASGDEAKVKDLTKAKERTFEFKVVAISKKSGMSFGSNSGLLINKDRADEINDYVMKDTEGYQRYVSAVINADEEANVDKIVESIKNIKDKKYNTSTAKEMQGFLFQIINVIQIVIVIFAGLALIASVFGIINTQYISVLERTSQIGLMKALGMSRKDVGKLFRYEAAWIGFLGGLVGSGFAVLLGTLVNPGISKALELENGMSILIFSLDKIVFLILGLMLVAIVAGWFPSRKASRLDPIEALRTE